MGKLIAGIFLILLCMGEIGRNFSHHFYPMLDDFGKQSLVWFILIFVGVYLVYSAGETRGKEFFEEEWGGGA